MTSLTFISKHFEIDNVYTFTFTTGGLTWRAGQYLALVIPEASPILEQYEHWFTISSAPFQQQIHITVRKRQSPFKQALFNLKPGDSIQAHTVDGDFVWPDKLHPVFIAGGIGITPFMSMLRQRQYQRMPVEADLYYFNRTPEIIFKNELETIAQANSEFNLHFLHEKPLSLTPILNVRRNWMGVLAFIAGPVPMVDRLGQDLKQRQIPYKQDYYFGYDVTNF